MELYKLRKAKEKSGCEYTRRKRKKNDISLTCTFRVKPK